MTYYAYVPDKNGKEPCGTQGRCLFKAKTNQLSRLKKMAQDRLGTGKNYRLYTYTHIYRESTYKLIHEQIHT